MSVNDASRIIIDDSRVILHVVASHTGNCRGIIYNHNMFIVKATGSWLCIDKTDAIVNFLCSN